MKKIKLPVYQTELKTGMTRIMEFQQVINHLVKYTIFPQKTIRSMIYQGQTIVTELFSFKRNVYGDKGIQLKSN